MYMIPDTCGMFKHMQPDFSYTEHDLWAVGLPDKVFLTTLKIIRRIQKRLLKISLPFREQESEKCEVMQEKFKGHSGKC